MKEHLLSRREYLILACLHCRGQDDMQIWGSLVCVFEQQLFHLLNSGFVKTSRTGTRGAMPLFWLGMYSNKTSAAGEPCVQNTKHRAGEQRHQGVHMHTASRKSQGGERMCPSWRVEDFTQDTFPGPEDALASPALRCRHWLGPSHPSHVAPWPKPDGSQPCCPTLRGHRPHTNTETMNWHFLPF